MKFFLRLFGAKLPASGSILPIKAIARLFSGTNLLDDEFFNGPDWQIGIKRFTPLRDLTLGIMPLRADAPVYFEASVKATLPQEGQVARVTKIELVPEYEWKVK